MTPAFDAINRVTAKFQLNPTALDLSLANLQQLANSALVEPGLPDHAFLMAIIAEGAAVPDPVPSFNAETTLGPVQAFMFNLWLSNEAIVYPASNGGEQGLGACESCEGECISNYALATIECSIAAFGLGVPPASLVCAAAGGAAAGFCAARLSTVEIRKCFAGS